MKLSEVKSILKQGKRVNFMLPNGTAVPQHFHITEVGLVTKKFIDCGGTVRENSYINFQLWIDNDLDHRLTPEKLLKIITLAEETFRFPNLEIEVEYQTETISKFDLTYNKDAFLLKSKQTDCLAPDKCLVPSSSKPKIRVSAKGVINSCDPQSGCC